MARTKSQLASSSPTTTTPAGQEVIPPSNPNCRSETTDLRKAMEAMNLRPFSLNSSVINLDMPTTNTQQFGTDIRSKLIQEETALEDMIVDLILEGRWEVLQPNSGKSVILGDGRSVSIGYQEEPGCSYRTWEWHGHVMVYEDGEGYVPEYVYGNYFEPLEDDDESELINMNPTIGLGGIISRASRAPLPSKAL